MKPQFDKNKKQSWSQQSCFEYDPEQWYQRYVLKQYEKPTPELRFGSEVGNKLATDPKFLPFVPRLSTFEFEFSGKWENIPLVGFADSFSKETFRSLREYKTGVGEWTQKKADGKAVNGYPSWGQIDMYLLLNWKMHKVRPEEVDVQVIWLPTKKVLKKDLTYTIEFVDDLPKNFKIFHTRRTMKQILAMGKRIEKNFKQMEAYAKKHK